MNYRNTSTPNSEYPKTLLIRNTRGGMIWQVYHVPNEEVADVLSLNSKGNGFLDRELTDHDPSSEETFPDWREQCSEDIKQLLV